MFTWYIALNKNILFCLATTLPVGSNKQSNARLSGWQSPLGGFKELISRFGLMPE
jgi:hypothetical protein